MIVDAHVHLFPPDVRAGRAHYAERDPFFGFLYASPRAVMVEIDELLAAMDDAEVQSAVVVGWPWQSGDDCRLHNDWAMAAAREHPDRLWPLGIVQPSEGVAAVRELERCVAGGMRGIGELNADGQRFGLADDGFMAVARAAEALQIPLLLHTNEPVGHSYPGKGKLPLADIYSFLRAVPELEVVLAHWGGGLPFYELMPEVKAAARHVSYDSAASPLLYGPEVFRHVVSLVGADKVLFGTDYPLNLYPKLHHEPAIRPMVDQVRALGLPADFRVMGENARRIYAPG